MTFLHKNCPHKLTTTFIHFMCPISFMYGALSAIRTLTPRSYFYPFHSWVYSNFQLVVSPPHYSMYFTCDYLFALTMFRTQPSSECLSVAHYGMGPKPHQCFKKSVDLKGLTAMRPAGFTPEVNLRIIQSMKHTSEGSTLALKRRAAITRSTSSPTKKTCVLQKCLKINQINLQGPQNKICCQIFYGANRFICTIDRTVNTKCKYLQCIL